jgi:hypothetical protein
MAEEFCWWTDLRPLACLGEPPVKRIRPSFLLPSLLAVR